MIQGCTVIHLTSTPSDSCLQKAEPQSRIHGNSALGLEEGKLFILSRYINPERAVLTLLRMISKNLPRYAVLFRFYQRLIYI